MSITAKETPWTTLQALRNLSSCPKYRNKYLTLPATSGVWNAQANSPKGYALAKIEWHGFNPK